MVYLLFMHIYTPIEVIREIKILTEDSFDHDLAKRLDVSKQSLSQYKNKQSEDVQLRIISLLLKYIEVNQINYK